VSAVFIRVSKQLFTWLQNFHENATNIRLFRW